MYTALRSQLVTLVGVLFVAGFLPYSAHAAVTASTMTRFTGQTSDNAGRSVVSGDLNNDGYDEIIIGASDGTNPGSVYIQYGSSTPATATSMTSSTVVELTGTSNNDEAGESLAIGDVNNDGYDDLLVGASKDDGAASNAGAFYVIYGSSTALTSGTLAAAGAKFTGEITATGLVGKSVATGDVNGDGYDDMLVGATGNNDGGAVAGAVLLIYGQSTAFTSATLTAATVAQITGKAAGDQLGTSVATGDVNNDSYDDILMGAAGNDNCAVGGSNNCGSVFIVYGSSTSLTNITLSFSTVTFTGEAASDGLNVVTTGDVNGDGYADIIMGATANDDAGADAGAVYIAYGQSTTLTSLSTSTLAEITGKAAGDQIGTSLTVADINNDGYDDVFSGARYNDDGAADAGSVWLTYGQATMYPTGATAVATVGTGMTGTTASESFGRSVALGDFNGDAYNDLLVGASAYSSLAGAGYVGYLGVDADEDGVLGTVGLLLTGTDCSDSDATVAANQTYYADADADGVSDGVTTTSVCSATAPTGYISYVDGTDPVDCSDTDVAVSEEQTYYADEDADTLGDPDSTTSVCSATAPEGYVDNTEDTDDTIANNGVEIGGDAVDNDGDGETDEANTISENGVHPFYSTLDPASADTFEDNVVAMTPQKNGKVSVEYADGSVYKYRVYANYEKDAKVKVVQYKNTGYVLVLHPTAKKLALVNVFDGTVFDTVKLSETGYTTPSLKVLDVRADGSKEAVITAEKKNNFGLFLVQVKTSKQKLVLKDSIAFSDTRVDPTKTTASKSMIKLNGAKGQNVLGFAVTKDYLFP